MSKQDTVFLDIEANGYLRDANKIWCIVSYYNNIYYIYLSSNDNYIVPSNSIIYNNIEDYLGFLKDKNIVAHNGISYDLPLLNKLYGFQYTLDTVIDTYILSSLYYPDREGHSIEYYGNLFGFQKGDHKDFSKLSQEMIDYCIRDVDILRRVYYHLYEEAGDWDWSEAIKLEYQIWDIQKDQELTGVLFDSVKAEELLSKITNELSEIDPKILENIPLRAVNKGELKKIFLKNGEYTQPVKEWYELNIFR